MLFTDGIILCPETLREHDNYVLEIASTESIELSSKLQVAQRWVGYELTSFLSSREAPVGISHVFVTDELRDLLAVQTLATVYRDAYYRHLNDRYEGRAKEFSALADRSLQRFLQNGVGLVTIAVPRAQQPQVDTAVAGGLAAGMYTVQIAWQHSSGTIGEWSEAVLADVRDGGLTVIPPAAPLGMSGWHLLLGFDSEKATRQNDAPIGPAMAWTQAAAQRTDLVVLQPSAPDFYIRSTTPRVRR
jgi:hypothetical protein